jgi:DNA-binding transcriptional LysR family regulator
VLTPWVLEFSSQYPAIELSIDLSDEKANLIEQGLDLSIRITGHLQPGDVVRKLADCPMVTFASPKYLSQHGIPQRPEDLEQHECLVYSNAPTRAQWVFQERHKKINVAVRGRMMANNGRLLAEAAAQDLGITRQPYFIAKPYLDNGTVRAVLGNYEVAPLGVYAVLPSNQYIPHRISVLIQFLAERLKVV